MDKEVKHMRRADLAISKRSLGGAQRNPGLPPLCNRRLPGFPGQFSNPAFSVSLAQRLASPKDGPGCAALHPGYGLRACRGGLAQDRLRRVPPAPGRGWKANQAHPCRLWRTQVAAGLRSNMTWGLTGITVSTTGAAPDLL